MLVLTRKTDETIKNGDDVEITVIRVRGNSVRIGIKAPKEIRVTRGELDSKPHQHIADAPKKTDQPLGHRESITTGKSQSPERPLDKQANDKQANDKQANDKRANDKRANDKMKRVNRIAAYSENQASAPSRIIIGRTTHDPQQPLLARGPLSDFLQNL